MSTSQKSSSIEQQRAEERIFALVERELNIKLEKNPVLYLSNNKYTYIQPDLYSAEHRVIGEIFAHIGKPKKRRTTRLQMIFSRCFFWKSYPDKTIEKS